MGNPRYYSPEQLEGHSVDHRTDIFSAGVTFYELLTYSSPHLGLSGLVHKFTNVFSWATRQLDKVILHGRVCASSPLNQSG
jgi:serine/threonine protein kinase